MVMRDAERIEILSKNIKSQVEYLVKKEAYLLAKSMRGELPISELPISVEPEPPIFREIKNLIEKVHKNIMAEIEKG